MNLLKAQDTKLKVEAAGFRPTIQEGFRSQKKIVISSVLLAKPSIIKLTELSEGLEFYIIPNLDKVGYIDFVIY